MEFDKEWVDSLGEEDLKETIQYLQNELEHRAERKLTNAWKKAKQSIEEYLRLGGTISFSLYNEQIHDYESYTLDESEIRITDDGEILLEN